MLPVFPRVIVIVLDSVGIGELPDASAYGDEGSNTVGNIAARVPLKIPTLRSLGLGKLVDLGRADSADAGSAAGVAMRDPAYAGAAAGVAVQDTSDAGAAAGVAVQ